MAEKIDPAAEQRAADARRDAIVAAQVAIALKAIENPQPPQPPASA